jgi:hypothetical protein
LEIAKEFFGMLLAISFVGGGAGFGMKGFLQGDLILMIFGTIFFLGGVLIILMCLISLYKRIKG